MRPASTPPTLTFGCSCGQTASSVSSVCRWNSSGNTCARGSAFSRHIASLARARGRARLDDGIHEVWLRDVVLAVHHLLQDARQHGALVQLQVHTLQLAQHLRRGVEGSVLRVGGGSQAARRRTSRFLPTRSRSSCRSFSRRSCDVAVSARAQAAHGGNGYARRTLSRAGPWCCMRTHSLFICDAAAAGARQLGAPQQHSACVCANLCEVLQDEVHRVLRAACMSRSAHAPGSVRLRRGACVPARCPPRPRTPSPCPAAGSC